MDKNSAYYPEDMSEAPKPGGKEESEAQSALIPKSMLQGYECKPGDRITLEVVHLYEDEAEVKFVSKEGEEEEEPEMEESSPEDVLDSLAISPD